MTTNHPSKKTAAVLAAAAIALGMSCESLESTDLNNPGIESLAQKPTRSGILAASTGLLIGHRQQVGQTNGYVSLTGILGRESYCFDKADPRFITEMLEAAALDPSSPAFGGNEWQQPYQNIRNANVVLGALNAPEPPAGGMSAGEKAAITGFAKTMQALDFLVVYNTRWDQGGPVDVNHPLADPPAPVVSKEEVLARVVQLLDEGAAQLAAPGASFPFAMSNGFVGFDTPDQFLKVNRAVRARAAVYQQDWDAADTALAASFLDDSPGLDLREGVYHSFGTGSGDVVNNLVSPNILAHPKLVTEAEAGDLRVAQKLEQLTDENGDPTTTTSRDLTTGYKFKLYPSPSSSIPIIRNEELILLRAEERFHRGDITGAYADINLIRQVSGGLAPVASQTDEATFVTELLKQRRYSLMFEGGHRWIDVRRLNRTNDPNLLDIVAPAAHPHHFSTFFPIPQPECLARTEADPSVAGKCSF